MSVGALLDQEVLADNPITDHVAAVSVGLYQGQAVLDLDYIEDSGCGADINVVMTGAGQFVEIQGTAEGQNFGRNELDQALQLAEQGIDELIAMQRQALGL